MASNQRGVLELFKVAGVQVEIDYSWLIIFVLILWSLSAGYFPVMYPGHGWLSYWVVGLVATVLFFASVLGHELSHAAMGNRLGENISRITLFIFGGMAHMSGEPKSARDELKIAAVGPLSSLILGVVFWLIAKGVAFSPAPVLWVAMFRYLAFINVALAVFNLVPPLTLGGLKARYKELVKLNHPDVHGGDKAAEERLKIINLAFATLKASYFP